VSITATSDSTHPDLNPTHVSGTYSVARFKVEFRGYKRLKKDVEVGIAKHYSDGHRRWVWGLSGSEDGRSFKYTLYDYWYGSNEQHRQTFKTLIESAKKGSSIQIRAKWSFNTGGLSESLALSTHANARLAHNMVHSEARHEQEVRILEVTRTPRCFEDALAECLDLEPCRTALEKSGFDWRRDNGVKLFVPPEWYEPIVEHLDVEHYEARHIIASDEFVLSVREVIRKLPSRHEVKVKREVSAVVKEQLPAEHDECEKGRLPIEVKNTFLHVRIPPSSSCRASTHPHTAPP